MRRRVALPAIAAGGAMLAAAACSDLSIEPAVDRIKVAIAAPSFRNDIEPILAETCASSGACHSGPNAQEELSLDPGLGYGELVNVPSSFGGILRVMPGFADSSLFYLVMSEDLLTRRGYTRMPVTGSPLPAPVRETIRNWIENGAPDN